MRQKISIAIAFSIALLIHVPLGPSQAAGPRRLEGASVAQDCDRPCLYGFVDQYLAALVARNPARLPCATNTQFTENNVTLAVGDGLWGTITGRGADDLRAA